MGVKHLSMAFAAEVKKSTSKFVLVALADYANENGEAYPSTETICRKTSLNRKTVLAGLKDLQAGGFLSDTGQRKGETGQIKVWELTLSNKPKNGTLKESQKRDGNVNQTVPKTDTKKPKNGTLKESQKRDIEPSVLLTIREPQELPTPKTRVGARKKQAPITTDTWTAYANAYTDRYGVAPVRNASINGQLANFVKRIGVDEAPHVAAFFLQSRNSYYASRGHSVGALLSDAEKLRTEWATGNQVTTTKARQADKSQTNFDAVSGALKILGR